MPDHEPLDDGSEVEIVCERDDPPSSGEWVDHEKFYDDLTVTEVTAGNHLGRTIDVDDDEDNGLDGDV